jgi:pimeloyl-ACP methyl ester carboxylesterase
MRSWKQGERAEISFTSLWGDVDRIRAPMLLVRGALSGVVSDDDAAELQRRQPGAEVVVVDGAGHSVQGDRPVELARILAEFADLD